MVLANMVSKKKGRAVNPAFSHPVEPFSCSRPNFLCISGCISYICNTFLKGDAYLLSHFIPSLSLAYPVNLALRQLDTGKQLQQYKQV